MSREAQSGPKYTATGKPDARRPSSVDRRKFVQTVLATIPAGFACALPSVASGSPSRGGGDQDIPPETTDWFCLVNILFTFEEVTYYLALNCRTNQTYVYAGPPNLPMGNCTKPEQGGCMRAVAFLSMKKTDDILSIVLSPDLKPSQKKSVEVFQSLMLMNA